jgi:hypothetical protein
MTKSLYLENKRTIFSLDNDSVNLQKHSFGLILYIILFVIFIPYLLVKYKQWNILAAYFPNLDLVATVIGYNGGPANSYIWSHLYNPTDSTIIGYITSNLINLYALLGVTFIIAYYTYVGKSIYNGWSRAFIMLPMTYFIPGNFIVYIMNNFGNYLNKFYLNSSWIHYLLVIISGFILSLFFILIEAKLIEKFVPHIIKLLKYIY